MRKVGEQTGCPEKWVAQEMGIAIKKLWQDMRYDGGQEE